MSDAKLITVHGEPVAGGKHPLICTPLVGASPDDLLRELAAVVPKQPDIIEWRADFFAGIADAETVIATGRRIRSSARGIPIIFTCRSAREGGQRIPLSEEGVAALLGAVCAARCVELVDFEMGNAPELVERVRAAAKKDEVPLILSYHNFQATPDLATLTEKFREADGRGGDVAKVAVMPKNLHDVLALLSATASASEELRIPLLSMSMGPLGSITRMIGWAFGSTLTFAVGQSSSAPGQIPIEDLRAVLAIAQRAVTGRP